MGEAYEHPHNVRAQHLRRGGRRAAAGAGAALQPHRPAIQRPPAHPGQHTDEALARLGLLRRRRRASCARPKRSRRRVKGSDPFLTFASDPASRATARSVRKGLAFLHYAGATSRTSSRCGVQARSRTVHVAGSISVTHVFVHRCGSGGGGGELGRERQVVRDEVAADEAVRHDGERAARFGRVARGSHSKREQDARLEGGDALALRRLVAGREGIEAERRVRAAAEIAEVALVEQRVLDRAARPSPRPARAPSSRRARSPTRGCARCPRSRAAPRAAAPARGRAPRAGRPASAACAARCRRSRRAGSGRRRWPRPSDRAA